MGCAPSPYDIVKHLYQTPIESATPEAIGDFYREEVKCISSKIDRIFTRFAILRKNLFFSLTSASSASLRFNKKYSNAKRVIQIRRKIIAIRRRIIV
ncbi:MAG TPA: hypothetical protein DCZ55_08525 [Cyanobacteria bacterium UBA11371]|nr:hypothetical protein [Cyanobacteria bacterium UBA11371]